MITTNAVRTSMKIPRSMVVFAKDSGSTKLEDMPGGGATSGIVDRSVPGGKEVMFADQKTIKIPMITRTPNNELGQEVMEWTDVKITVDQ